MILEVNYKLRFTIYYLQLLRVQIFFLPIMGNVIVTMQDVSLSTKILEKSKIKKQGKFARFERIVWSLISLSLMLSPQKYIEVNEYKMTGHVRGENQCPAISCLLHMRCLTAFESICQIHSIIQNIYTFSFYFITCMSMPYSGTYE